MDGDNRSSHYAVGRDCSPQSRRRCLSGLKKTWRWLDLAPGPENDHPSVVEDSVSRVLFRQQFRHDLRAGRYTNAITCSRRDPSDGGRIHLGDCIANDREGILSNLAVDPPAHHLAKMIADPSLVSALTYHLEWTS